jgi:hypothetical protein
MLRRSPTISITTTLGPGVGTGVGEDVGDGLALGVGEGVGSAAGAGGAAIGVDDGCGEAYGLVGVDESVPPQALSNSAARTLVMGPPVRAAWRVMNSPSVDMCPVA